MARDAKISDWTLERYALADLEPGEMAAVEARLREDPELAGRLAALRQSDREILQDYPVRPVVAEVRRRARPPVKAARNFALVFAPAMALAALVLVLRPAADVSPDGNRLKGAIPKLSAYRLVSGAPQPVRDHESVRPGEAIQLRYQAAGRAFGAIVSIDGAGGVTLHWPENAGASARLEPSGEATLPNAFELDAAPGFERFFFVTSREPISVDAVLAAARALAARPGAEERALDLPSSFEQSSLSLRKERR